MYGDTQSVLRCGQCNKPFDKESTLKRHGYYCRSRKVGTVTRSRSCISCAKGKSRCDNTRPECSRCLAKGTKCHYPADTPKGPSGDSPTVVPETAPFTTPPTSFSIETLARANHVADAARNSGFAMSDPELVGLGRECFAWDDSDINFAEFLNLPTNEENTQYCSSSSPTVEQAMQIHRGISSLDSSIPTMPTYTLRSLLKRPKLNAGAQRIANLMVYTLKSYPLTMLQHNALPPFIHPHLLSSNAETNYMEPLTNCVSLVHMISSGLQGSRKLFWKNVRLECERWCAEHARLNKWELLAIMQALSIYILIRLDEGETDHNNIDVLLLATVTVTAKGLTCIDAAHHTQSTLCKPTADTSWKEWIFNESRRRLGVVYRVVNMLVYFDPAPMCELDMGLVLAPLPGKKQLWEANDELAWKREVERDNGVQDVFGLASNGDLVKLYTNEGNLFCSDAMLLRHKSLNMRALAKRPANWEEWCSGMDGFGGLVMLAASFIV